MFEIWSPFSIYSDLFYVLDLEKTHLNLAYFDTDGETWLAMINSNQIFIISRACGCNIKKISEIPCGIISLATQFAYQPRERSQRSSKTGYDI